MDWPTIKPAIQTLIASLTGLPAEWTDQWRQFVDPISGAGCYLRVSSTRARGVDENRIAEVPNAPVGQELQLTISGTRIWTLSVRVESYSQDFASESSTYVERLRTRLRRPSSLSALRAVGTALVSVEAAADISEFFDDRAVSVTQMDVILASAVNDLDAPFGYIARVEGTGTIEGATPEQSPWSADLA